ncbi:MAG: SH3 domain-containing protein [Anaerolineales bacterium]|nr:SH3 domain-containing protein [Anaerolineales bacterium]
MANVIGPDVSFYQDDPQTPQGIEFSKMRANAGYVVIRAGQNLWADRDFKLNWREAKLAGLPRGSYWFYDSRADPKQQADLWISLLNGDFGELPLFADFEDNYGGSFKGWKHWYTFIERLKELASGKEVAIYTAYYYWVENTLSARIPAASLDYFKQYPLWIANYGVTKPLFPKPWTDWTFWQFTSKGDGSLYGVESKNIDLNYFNGNLKAFRQRFGLSDAPSPISVPVSKYFKVTAPSLKVRSGPGFTQDLVGRIFLNEVVEELDATSDRYWLNIRKGDGSLAGWSFSPYLKRVKAGVLEPTPSVNWYRVTATSLRVRKGPGTTFEQIGSILRNEVVEVIGENSDRAWLNIRKPDGSLTGWCSSKFLQKTSAPATTPTPTLEPELDEEDTNWYRVTASSLKVRQEPGLDYEALGLVTIGELVEKIGASSDGSWLKIQNTDGTLTGWSPSEYLQNVKTPVLEEPPATTPVPDHSDKNWYRINTATLNVCESPSTSSKSVGTVLKNDTIPALDDTSNPDWVQIQRLDGLTGWCSKSYLVPLGHGHPASIRQSLFPGITYLRKDLTSPRPNVVHVIAIDLQNPKLEFLVTPSPNKGNILCTRVTSKFLEEFKLHVAINGGYYSYLDASHDPATYCPNGGDPVRISDYAASRGKIYSPKKTAQPVIYIGPRNQVTINKEQGNVFNAVSGDRIVVNGGLVVNNLAANAPNPRTAIGINKTARWLTLMVMDGRQPGYSEGVTFPELAELLISYGVHTGVNMDGGGSSTMTIRGFDGKARVLNSPIDMNKTGKERAVANHLGLFIRP